MMKSSVPCRSSMREVGDALRAIRSPYVDALLTVRKLPTYGSAVKRTRAPCKVVGRAGVVDVQRQRVVSLELLSRQPPNRLREQPAMTVALTLFTTAAVVIVGSIVLSTVLQMRGQRVAIKHQAEVRKRLDEQNVEMAANRERFEQRTQQLRETQHESLELKRREIALREEQAASLKQLVAMHEQLLSALRSQRPS